MCRILGISRASYYYQTKEKRDEKDLEDKIKEAFKIGRQNYGTRKIKKYLKANYNLKVSRRKIGKIMKKYGLESNYTKQNYKPQKSQSNESKTQNKLNREFKEEKPLKKIVTDLTYVKVGNKWNYVCLVIDLFNREIIGYSTGKKKDAELILIALKTIPYSLSEIELIHTDRGKEFDNKTIDSILKTFNIERSLSGKGCPYDNAVAESTYNAFKVEFIYQNKFKTLEELNVLLFDYIHWWNNIRYHGSLEYETPMGYKEKTFDVGLL